MDFSLIGAASTAISSAREFGKAALAVRDFNQMAAIVSQLNDQILKAQDALFAHNTQLLSLQQEVFEARKQLREMEEALSESRRYSLFEITPGSFVYRVNASPEGAGTSDPGSAEPLHYICQPCFDGAEKRKVVLRLTPAGPYKAIPSWSCPTCNTTIHIRR